MESIVPPQIRQPADRTVSGYGFFRYYGQFVPARIDQAYMPNCATEKGTSSQAYEELMAKI